MKSGGDGWESNPPRTPQQRPANSFEDRVSDIRCRPPTSAPDRNRAPGFRRRSLTVANVRQNGCQLGCQNLCFRPTHGPEPCRWRLLEYPVGSAGVRLNSNSGALVSFRVLLDPLSAGNLCPVCAPTCASNDGGPATTSI